jgi:hypothetical protein
MSPAFFQRDNPPAMSWPIVSWVPKYCFVRVSVLKMECCLDLSTPANCCFSVVYTEPPDRSRERCITSRHLPSFSATIRQQRPDLLYRGYWSIALCVRALWRGKWRLDLSTVGYTQQQEWEKGGRYKQQLPCSELTIGFPTFSNFLRRNS